MSDALTVPPTVTGSTGTEPGLQADGGTGLEARPALLTLVTPGGAPVCEGDSCVVPGAEGYWDEVPD